MLLVEKKRKSLNKTLLCFFNLFFFYNVFFINLKYLTLFRNFESKIFKNTWRACDYQRFKSLKFKFFVGKKNLSEKIFFTTFVNFFFYKISASHKNFFILNVLNNNFYNFFLKYNLKYGWFFYFNCSTFLMFKLNFILKNPSLSNLALSTCRSKKVIARFVKNDIFSFNNKYL